MTNIVVRPVRFTDAVEPMRRFLQTIGLQPRIEAEGGGWVDLVAASGMIAVHEAATSDSGGRAGQTRLSFEANDLEALAAGLRRFGARDVAVYDESYGQVLACRDPLGDEVRVDGVSEDLYGYRALDADRPDFGLAVVPVRFTDPSGPYGDWLEALGLHRVGEPDESYVMYDAGDGRHGYVGVHYVYADVDALPIVPGPAAAHLTFATREPLDDVAARLVAAGYDDARVIVEDFGAMLSVTDPDGQEVQVHEAP
jgi:hypothetical protein